MQIILPIILEESTALKQQAPAHLNSLLLKGADVSMWQGNWGYLLAQTFTRKDYTLHCYNASVQEELNIYVLSQSDKYALLASTQGSLKGTAVLEPFQSQIFHFPAGIRNQCIFEKGKSRLWLVSLNNLPPQPLADAVFLPAEAMRLLESLPRQLQLHITPGLYVDGLVASLLAAYYQASESQDAQRYLLEAPFHLNAEGLGKIRLAKAIIDNSLHEKFTLASLAKKAGTNTDLLKKAFKHVYGQPAHQYMLEARLNQARALAKEKDKTVREIAGLCGFRDVPHFIQQFKKKWGVTPKQLRKKT